MSMFAVDLLYGALEMVAMLLFWRPYAHQGLSRPCDTRAGKALRLGLLLFATLFLTVLRTFRSTMNMGMNIGLHFCIVSVVGCALYAMPLAQCLNGSLVFHLTMDMCCSLMWDMLPFLTRFRAETCAYDRLMLTLPLMALLIPCCLVVRRYVCHFHNRRMNKTMMALVFVSAIPYLYVKTLQYRSYFLQNVSYSGTISTLCFLVCLLAVCVSSLSNRLIEGIERERQAEHEHMALHAMQAQIAQHQQQIDSINKLSHDMRNHLSTLAAMGGSKEAEAYIAALTNRFAPIAVQKISGCAVLDVLLAQKVDTCSRIGASLIPCISQEALPALSSIADPDLCTLYGNLLDNAIEAVEGLADGDDKTITLRTTLRGSLLVIRTENRYRGDRLRRGGSFSTTKEDTNAHGYGLRSIRDCVHSLGGEMTISDADRMFVVNILLPMQRK